VTITLYAGLPGSGKTYGVVENVMLPAFKEGRELWTNIPLVAREIHKVYPRSVVIQFSNDEVNGEFLIDIPGGAIVVLDECWRFWPSGLKASEISTEEKEFFSEHRHKVGQSGQTQEIVLITQSPSQIARCVKDLVDQTVITKKNSSVGSDNTYSVDIYQSINVKSQAIFSGFGTYKQDVYKYYKSHTKSETGNPGFEKRVDKRGKVWNHPLIIYGVPFAVLLFIIAAYALYSLYSNKFGYTEKSLHKEVSQEHITNDFKPKQEPINTIQPKPENRPPSQELKEKAEDSDSWRVVGLVSADGNSIILLKKVGVKRLMRVNSNECQFTPSGPLCLIQGKTVTYWTGKSDKEIVGSVFSQPSKDLSLSVPPVFGGSGEQNE